MKIFKAAALALVLGASGTAMAADGPLGPTSSAQMNVWLTVVPNTDNYVQIVGLDDQAFPNVTAGTQIQQTLVEYFCLNKNTPGNVSLKVTGSVPFSTDISYSGYLINELVSGPNKAEIQMLLRSPTEGFTSPNSDGWVGLDATNPSTCTASSGTGVAYTLETRISPQNILVEGGYSNTFGLTVTPE